jgi:hypothetical protein
VKPERTRLNRFARGLIAACRRLPNAAVPGLHCQQTYCLATAQCNGTLPASATVGFVGFVGQALKA